MDNPAFFTILWRTDDLDWHLTDAGLFGSLVSANDEAAKRQANTDVPDLEFAVAVVTMQDQDPFTGTPLGHINPPRATGYCLASLSVADTERRSLDHTLHEGLRDNAHPRPGRTLQEPGQRKRQGPGRRCRHPCCSPYQSGELT